MRYWIRDFLGITELYRYINTLETRMRKLEQAVGVTAPALAKIVAVLDPIYGVPEDNPERRAASDQLGEAVLNKMIAEAAERDKYNYSLKEPPK